MNQQYTPYDLHANGLGPIRINSPLPETPDLFHLHPEQLQEYFARTAGVTYFELRPPEKPGRLPEIAVGNVFIATDLQRCIRKIIILSSGPMSVLMTWIERAIHEKGSQFESRMAGAETRFGYVLHSQNGLAFTIADLSLAYNKPYFLIEIFDNTDPVGAEKYRLVDRL